MDIAVAMLVDKEEAVYFSTLVNNDPLMMFTKKKEEGCFKILILRHLIENETTSLENILKFSRTVSVRSDTSYLSHTLFHRKVIAFLSLRSHNTLCLN